MRTVPVLSPLSTEPPQTSIKCRRRYQLHGSPPRPTPRPDSPTSKSTSATKECFLLRPSRLPEVVIVGFDLGGFHAAARFLFSLQKEESSLWSQSSGAVSHLGYFRGAAVLRLIKGERGVGQVSEPQEGWENQTVNRFQAVTQCKSFSPQLKTDSDYITGTLGRKWKCK